MRKIAFVKIPDNIQKLMIYDSSAGVYLFGYDCLQDRSALWENWYEKLAQVEEYCKSTYQVDIHDWIEIAEPCTECQHDFIMQTRVKGRDNDNPQRRQFQTFENGKWVDILSSNKYHSFDGLTGNERLYITGLMKEFENAKKKDIKQARKILSALDFDKESIGKIL